MSIDASEYITYVQLTLCHRCNMLCAMGRPNRQTVADSQPRGAIGMLNTAALVATSVLGLSTTAAYFNGIAMTSRSCHDGRFLLAHVQGPLRCREAAWRLTRHFQHKTFLICLISGGVCTCCRGMLVTSQPSKLLDTTLRRILPHVSCPVLRTISKVCSVMSPHFVNSVLSWQRSTRSAAGSASKGAVPAPGCAYRRAWHALGLHIQYTKVTLLPQSLDTEAAYCNFALSRSAASANAGQPAFCVYTYRAHALPMMHANK